MAGFRKCGIYPLNRGEINDRVLAPSTACQKANSPSPSVASGWDEALFEKRFQECYDVQDEEYMSWLKVRHPESVKTSSTGSTDLTAIRPSTAPPSSSNSPLDDILVILKAKSPGKRRKMATTKARLITDDDVVDDDVDNDLKKKKEQKQKQPLERKSRKKTESIRSRQMTRSQKKSTIGRMSSGTYCR